MTSKVHRRFDVTFDGVLMSVRSRFDVGARVGGVAISVDIRVGIGVALGVHDGT